MPQNISIIIQQGRKRHVNAVWMQASICGPLFPPVNCSLCGKFSWNPICIKIGCTPPIKGSSKEGISPLNLWCGERLPSYSRQLKAYTFSSEHWPTRALVTDQSFSVTFIRHVIDVLFHQMMTLPARVKVTACWRALGGVYTPILWRYEGWLER